MTDCAQRKPVIARSAAAPSLWRRGMVKIASMMRVSLTAPTGPFTCWSGGHGAMARSSPGPRRGECLNQSEVLDPAGARTTSWPSPATRRDIACWRVGFVMRAARSQRLDCGQRERHAAAVRAA